jgi:4-aminobutyrate aminotransferase-like enzyme
VLTLVPPLTITDAELNDAIDILTAAMHHVVQTQAGL